MIHRDITQFLEHIAPPYLCEPYDNVGFIVGSDDDVCTGVMVALDCTLAVARRAKENHCNLIITHHPLIFTGIKKIGKNHCPEEVIRFLIKHDITHYALHTNIDNVLDGMSKKIIEQFALKNYSPIVPKENVLCKLIYYAPSAYIDAINQALYEVGAGSIGKYDACSFSSEGIGTFLPADGTHPFVGETGTLNKEKESRVELIFPIWLSQKIRTTLLQCHPYEEVAYDIIPLQNHSTKWGSGVSGNLPNPMKERDFLQKLAQVFDVQYLRHTALRSRMITKLAFCGGSGASFIRAALNSCADVYITGDLKYHDFLDYSDTPLLLVDIGHWESERHIVDFLYNTLSLKFPKFAVIQDESFSSPVCYFNQNE